MVDFKMKKIEKDIDIDAGAGPKLILGGIIGVVLFYIVSALALTCGIIYVAFHFIMKLW